MEVVSCVGDTHQTKRPYRRWLVELKTDGSSTEVVVGEDLVRLLDDKDVPLRDTVLSWLPWLSTLAAANTTTHVMRRSEVGISVFVVGTRVGRVKDPWLEIGREATSKPVGFQRNASEFVPFALDIVAFVEWRPVSSSFEVNGQ